MNYIIGIDEAGRGPWAGPVVVWGFLVQKEKSGQIFWQLVKLDDSKKLTEKEREGLFHDIERLQFEQECQYTFAYRDAHMIDELGIREANRQSMQDVILSLLQFVSQEDAVEIWVDGCDNYRFDLLETIGYHFAKKARQKKQPAIENENKRIQIRYQIGWDGIIPAISAASIVAKVVRDRMMCEFHEDFPEYGFGEHKGYGTKQHQQALLNHGITSIHRKSYAPVKRLISADSSV